MSEEEVTSYGASAFEPPDRSFGFSSVRLWLLSEYEGLGERLSHRPWLLEDLRKNVLPSYETRELESTPGFYEPRYDLGTEESPELHEWAKRWNLTDAWCLRAARLTLEPWARPQLAEWNKALGYDPDSLSPFRVWRKHPDLARSGIHLPLPGEEGHTGSLEPEPIHPSPHRFPLRMPGWSGHAEHALPPWNPEVEAWKDYADAARAIFQHALSRYGQVGRTRAEKRGLVPNPASAKRPRKGSPTTLHFQWTARHQSGRETYKEIARRPALDPDHPSKKTWEEKSVANAVRKVRAAIGLSPPK